MTVRLLTFAIAAMTVAACGATRSAASSQPAGPAVVELRCPRLQTNT